DDKCLSVDSLPGKITASEVAALSQELTRKDDEGNPVYNDTDRRVFGRALQRLALLQRSAPEHGLLLEFRDDCQPAYDALVSRELATPPSPAEAAAGD